MGNNNYIQVPFPHMVLNSHNVPEPDYEMWNSWKVASSKTPEDMAKWIKVIAEGAENKKLATLIFNSHGSPGKIHIGTGLTEYDLHHFKILKKDAKSSLCDQIWIIACEVSGQNDNVSGGANGETFCKMMAEATNSLVTAAVRKQPASGAISIPPWHVDDWVGEVFTYYPSGVKVQRQ